MEWLNSLEDQLKSSLSSDVPKSNTLQIDVSPKLPEKPEERKNDMDEIFNKKNMPVLLLVALAIVIITWFNYQEKLNNQLSNNMQMPGQITDLNQVPPWYQNQNNNNAPSINNSPTLDKKVELLTVGTQKIWERTKWNTDSLILLSIINNNNSFVLKNNYPKSELIFLNSDWTINKMPTAVQLDDEDKEFLRKFVR